MSEKTKTVLSGLKEKAVRVCSVVNERIAGGFHSAHCVEGVAFLMKGCAFHLYETCRERGYNVQRFSFTERESDGILVQVENSNMEWKDDFLYSLGGQRLAVNVRFMEKGNDLNISVGNGKWVDKALSGVLAWTVFAPLVVFPVVGMWRQKKLIECIERDVLEWLDAHRHDGCIDVSM